MSRAVTIVSQSGGTVRIAPIASFERDVIDAGLVEGHHHAVVPLLDGPHGRSTEPIAEQPIVGCRGTAPHDVTEHRRAGLPPGQPAQFAGRSGLRHLPVARPGRSRCR